jgi:hypothetical protein
MPKGVGEVKTVTSGTKSGFGFTVNDDSGKAIATLAFPSKEMADKAKQRLAKLVQRASWVSAA